MVRDQDHGPLLDSLRDPLRACVRALLPLLPVLPKLSEQRDRWAEWLVRSRYEGRSEEEIAEMQTFLAGVRERVLGRARIERDDAVLDVGTGTGLLALGALERLGEEGEVVALDISVDCLEELRATCRDARVWYQLGSAEVIPLPDASVDVVMTRSVLIYVRQKAEAAREFLRVLRSGGRLSLFEPINRRNTQLWEVVDFGDLRDRVIEDFQRRWPPDHPMQDFDAEDLDRHFANAGFDELSTEVEDLPQTVRPEGILFGIGAPGSPRLVDAWQASFSEAEIEHLVAAVRRSGESITLKWPALYLRGVKP